jgi:hypothetical protein
VWTADTCEYSIDASRPPLGGGFDFGAFDMIRMIILLPGDDTIKHIQAVCGLSIFKSNIGERFEPIFEDLWGIPVNYGIWIQVADENKKKKSSPQKKLDIGNIAVLPARENSVIILTPSNDSTQDQFETFVKLIKEHFQSLTFLLDTQAEPWKKSPPDKQERDRTIWEHRNLGYTWEQVAEFARCGVSTAKERYRDMTIIVAADSG